jgi:hypothetical protein
LENREIVVLAQRVSSIILQSFTSYHSRVPDAVQRGAKRNGAPQSRDRTDQRPELGTVPVLRRITTCCVAPGTRKIPHTHPPSREANPSEPCQISPVRGRSADRRRVRRHPIFRADHKVHASPRREAFTVCAPGDARLSALHRGGLLAASAPGRNFRTLPIAAAS